MQAVEYAVAIAVQPQTRARPASRSRLPRRDSPRSSLFGERLGRFVSKKPRSLEDERELRDAAPRATHRESVALTDRTQFALVATVEAAKAHLRSKFGQRGTAYLLGKVARGVRAAARHTNPLEWIKDADPDTGDPIEKVLLSEFPLRDTLAALDDLRQGLEDLEPVLGRLQRASVGLRVGSEVQSELDCPISPPSPAPWAAGLADALREVRAGAKKTFDMLEGRWGAFPGDQRSHERGVLARVAIQCVSASSPPHLQCDETTGKGLTRNDLIAIEVARGLPVLPVGRLRGKDRKDAGGDSLPASQLASEDHRAFVLGWKRRDEAWAKLLKSHGLELPKPR
jgi:hypothetical protein